MQVSEDILSLKPYLPGKPIEETKREYNLSSVFKLASNENALGPSKKVLAAIQVAAQNIHRYPDPSCFDLRNKFSEVFEVTPESVSFGNGSNELIDLLIRIYCEPGDKILTMESAFMAYKICAQAARVKTTSVALQESNLKSKVEDLLMAWDPQHKIVFIPNPNNPTGSYYNQKEVEKIIHFFGNREDVLLVFDEAYVEYASASDFVSALKYQKQYSNLVILRTLSKAYGLAGLRVGAVFAHPEVIGLIDRIRNPFNVNSIAQAAALAAVDDYDYINRSIEGNKKGLKLFYSEFKKHGIKYFESQGNFVLFDCGRQAKPIVEKLLQRGIIVRPVKNYGFDTFIRLSVGVEQENQAAISAIVKVMNEETE